MPVDALRVLMSSWKSWLLSFAAGIGFGASRLAWGFVDRFFWILHDSAVCKQ